MGSGKQKTFKRMEATRIVFITDDEANWNNSQKFNSGLEYEKVKETKSSGKKAPEVKTDDDLI